MQRRSYMGTGSPYPTGKSPLVLDIERNIQGVVQQQVDNKKTEIKEKKLAINENEQMILDALDMQAVEGMGDKAALEFGDGLDKLKETWSRKFYENEGSLNTQDKLELRKDKSKLEQKLKVAAADIKAIAETKKQLAIQASRPDKKGLYDFNKVSKWITDYERSGKVGTGSFVSGITYAQPEFGEEVLSKYGKALETASKSFDDKVVGINRETGLVTKNKSNKRKLEEIRTMIENDPQYLGLPEGQRKEWLDKVMMEYGVRGSSDDFNAGLQRMNTGASNSHSSRKGWENLTQDQADNMAYWNNLAEGIFTGDREALRSIEGSIDKKLGTIKTAQYDVDNEKGDAIILTNSDGKKERIPIPSSRDMKTNVKTTKKTFLDRFSQLTGKQVPANVMNYIEADWDEFEASEPAKPVGLLDAEATLRTGLDDINKNKDDYNERNPSKRINLTTKEEYLNSIIDAIKKVVPDAKVAKGKGGMFTSNSHFIVVTDNDGKEKQYDLRNETDRNELSDWMTESSKYKERGKKEKSKEVKEVLVTLKNGKKAYFDEATKKFIRYAE